MGLIQHRDFSVKYTDVSEDRWLVSAQLVDQQHNIVTELEIDIPTLSVSNAGIDFIKYPLKQCLELSEKARELIGCSVIHELSQTLDRYFSGPYGCPNVRHLFGISGPGFIYVYYPKLLSEKKMNQDDWWKMAVTTLRDDCIAHKKLAEQFTESK
jgi:hypothetical protein